MVHLSFYAIPLLLTFIKLPFVIKTFVLSIFEWPFYTGFTVILDFSELFAKVVRRQQKSPVAEKM